MKVNIASRIRDRRISIGMTQKQLADKLGITYQQVQKYESARSDVDASRLYHISQLLFVPISYFFTEIDGGKKTHDKTEDAQQVAILEAFSRIEDRNIRKKLSDLLRGIAMKDDVLKF